MVFSLLQPIVRSFIRSQLTLGLSRNAVWRSLPSVGFPKFHKQTFLNTARTIWNEVQSTKAIQALIGDIAIPHSIMVDDMFPYPSKYWIKGTVNLYDQETGEEFQQHMSFYSNSNLGKDGWAGQFITKYLPQYGEEELEIFGVNVDLVIHQEGWSY